MRGEEQRVRVCARRDGREGKERRGGREGSGERLLIEGRSWNACATEQPVTHTHTSSPGTPAFLLVRRAGMCAHKKSRNVCTQRKLECVGVRGPGCSPAHTLQRPLPRVRRGGELNRSSAPTPVRRLRRRRNGSDRRHGRQGRPHRAAATTRIRRSGRHDDAAADVGDMRRVWKQKRLREAP